MIKHCRMCGVEFASYHGTVYCSDGCRNEGISRTHDLSVALKREREKVGDVTEARRDEIYSEIMERHTNPVKKCEICKKEFRPRTWNEKYCGDWCRRVAKARRAAKYRLRKAGGNQCQT